MPNSKLPPKIAVFTEDLSLTDKVRHLSQHLELPIAKEPHLYDYLFLVTPNYLGIQKTTGKTCPFYFDFSSPKFQYRLRHASVKKEIIAKAMGLKASSRLKIVDATAGLARDSFVLASLGFEVTMLERSTIIAELLKDALLRTKQDPNHEATVDRLKLVPTDAKQWLQEHGMQERPEIIYLDPMFPHRHKSALVKKDMQFFQELVGEDPDAGELLKVALSCATKRVVVKRPRIAEPLANQKPSFSFEGSSSRFDVYLR